MACPLCTACARCSAVDLPCHPAPTERAPAPVRHLHVPKTGTSFAYTLVAHRCGGVLPPEQLFVYLANVSRRGRQAVQFHHMPFSARTRKHRDLMLAGVYVFFIVFGLVMLAIMLLGAAASGRYRKGDRLERLGSMRY